MPLVIHCANPSCRASYKIADAAFGRTAVCRVCQERMLVLPSASEESDLPALGILPDRTADVLGDLAAFASKYDLRRKVGPGRQATTYLGFSKELGRYLAVKVLPETLRSDRAAVERFLNAGRAGLSFRRPGMRPIVEVGEAGGVPFVAGTVVPGISLGSLIRRDQPIPTEHIVVAAYRIAALLTSLHADGFTHGNLKSSNVILSHKGTFVLTDAGLALDPTALRMSGADAASHSLALAALAPEQLRPGGDGSSIGTRTDVYAFGLLIYELIAGRQPFTRVASAIESRILRGEFSDPLVDRPDVPASFGELIDACVKVDPAGRLGSMRDVFERVDAIRVALAKARTVVPAPTAVVEQEEPPKAVEVTTPLVTGTVREIEVERAATVADEGVALRFVTIPAGSFSMGSPPDDPEASDDEPYRPQTIARPYAIANLPVTQGEYERSMGKNPSTFRGSLRLPVEGVTWFEAVAYCNARSLSEGLTPYYDIGPEGSFVVRVNGGDGYRLPTEAEWEHACRAGDQHAGPYPGGFDPATLRDVAWYADSEEPAGSTHEVGCKQADASGLHDMRGLVWEWCWDAYSTAPSEFGWGRGPKSAAIGKGPRVARGGSWKSPAKFLRSAARLGYPPTVRSMLVGFRLARDAAEVVATADEDVTTSDPIGEPVEV